MKKTKLEKIIEYIREEMATAPTNHTGEGVKNFDPVMSHMARRKKSPVSNWIKSAISNDKKRKNIIARFQ